MDRQAPLAAARVVALGAFAGLGPHARREIEPATAALDLLGATVHHLAGVLHATAVLVGPVLLIIQSVGSVA